MRRAASIARSSHRVSAEPVAGVHPALGDGACANVGVGCTTRARAAVTIGTSAAARVVYASESAEARPGLFLYRLDERRFCDGGALSDGGNLHAWLVATLREVDDAALVDRPAAAHGLVFLPFLGGERSLGWDPARRGLIRGLTFATTPLDLAQAALEGVCYRLAAVLDAIGGDRVGRRERRRAPRERGLGADPRRRARLARSRFRRWTRPLRAERR